METPTNKQRNVLQKVIEFFEVENRPPTTRELAGILKVHIKTVYQYLLVLERKGCIERREGRIYPVEHLLPKGIPILGRVAAGKPILAVENISGHLPWIKGEKNLFALRINGDSMIGAHICEGDYVVVKQQPTIENGEIGVALINDEATVKRIWIEGNEIRLVPENPAHETMLLNLDSSDVRIIGKIVGLIRQMGTN